MCWTVAAAPDGVLIDANLPLWAHHRQFPQHARAHAWWAATLTDTPLVGIPWVTILAFLRISTHPRALARPATIDAAWGIVSEWLGRPNVRLVDPTDRHSDVLGQLLTAGRATGDHTTDAHLAALAITWGLELQSADRDFARYPALRWRDPLA